MKTKWPTIRLGEVVRLDLDRVPIDVSRYYPMVGVLSFGRGLFGREPIENGKTSYKYFFRLKADHVVMSQLFGWEGALALSSDKFAGKYVSPQFPTFLCEERKLNREFLGWPMRRPTFWEELGSRASGLGDRRRTLNPDAFFACVPSSIKMPEIVAEPTGEIGFEWRKGKDQIFVISVGGKQKITFAGIFGENRIHGVEYFGGTLPLVVIQHLRRLYS